MGEYCGSWFPWQQLDLQLPNLNSAAPPHLGQRDPAPGLMNSGSNMVSAKGTFPVYGYPELHHTQVGFANEPRGWFYCLPRFRQAFTPVSNPVMKEQLPVIPYENLKDSIMPAEGPGTVTKRFLVFDQSGDQTTLIFSSGIGTHFPCLTSWSPKPPGAYDLNKDAIQTKGGLDLDPAAVSADEFDDNNETDAQSEMQEDTEELNALLYSDDDSDYTEDDEVTSTGHSPSTMTAHDRQDSFEGSTDGIASSIGPTKKRKLFDDGDNDDVPSLLDTASSVKPTKCLDYRDDAESSFANGSHPGTEETVLLSGNKRMRKDKIRETVSVLRSIIPGGEGKEPLVVLDEAIIYLKSLKLKAKGFGLHSL